MAQTYVSTANLNAGVNAMAVPSTTYYASLHTTSPGFTGANELTGGSYARQALIFGSATIGLEVTTDAQNWASLPSCTLGYFGWWSTLTGGTWEAGGALGSSLTVPAGATVAAAIGAISAGVSG